MGTETLRETISNALDEKIESTETVEQKPAVEAPVEAQVETAPVDKPGRTAGRERDEQGRLLPGPAKRPPEISAAEPGKAPPASQPTAQAIQAAPAAETKPKYQRPSTWKKETWGVWDKLNKGEQLSPQEIDLMAQEAIRRDQDFARGVSTYKQEWETAKPLIDAMAPFMPLLQQHGIQPSQWISNLGKAHQTLALGSDEQRLAAFIRLAGEYRVPVERMFVKGQDGQVYFNQQLMQQQAPPQQPAQDVRKTVQEFLAEERANQEVEAMRADTKNFPHFEEVRETIKGLLLGGLAPDLRSAHDAAIRMPQHSHIWDAMQKQQREQEAQEKAEAARKAAEAARRKFVSPRSGTPTSVSSGGEGKKGLRGTIEEAFDSTVAGRV